MQTDRKAGFTLIELLVVIALIGLLSSVTFASLSSARSKARDALRLAQIKELVTALELYAIGNNGNYPDDNQTSNYWVCLGHTTSEICWNGSYTGNNALNTTLESYISPIPDDPRNNTSCFGDAYAYHNPEGDGSATLHWYYESNDTSNAACGRGYYGGNNSCGNYCYLDLIQ